MGLFVDIFLWAVFLDNKVVDDEVLTLHRILTHIVFEKLLHLVGLMEGHLFQTDIRTDETRKFLW